MSILSILVPFTLWEQFILIAGNGELVFRADLLWYHIKIVS